MATDKAPTQSGDEEVKDDVKPDADSPKDSKDTIPQERVDKLIEQREEFKARAEASEGRMDKLQETITELKDSVKDKQDKSGGEVFTAEEEASLDKISKGLKEKKFLTKEDLDEVRRIDARNSEITRLTGKYSKDSGFPEFVTEEVMVHAKKKGFGDNLEAAYRDIHFQALVQVETKKGGEGGDTTPPDSEPPVGGDRPVATEMGIKEIGNMGGEEYEKERPTILQRFKKAATGK